MCIFQSVKQYIREILYLFAPLSAVCGKNSEICIACICSVTIICA